MVKIQMARPTLQREIIFNKPFELIIATAVLGPLGQGKCMWAHCDNHTVVDILQYCSSKDCHLMHLLPCLFFTKATYYFEITITHTVSAKNSLAHNLPNDHLSSSLQKSAKAQPHTIPIPTRLL